MDLDLLLRETADVAAPRPPVLDAARDLLDDATARHGRRVGAVVRHRRRALAAAGLSVAAAATVVAVPAIGFHGRPSSSAQAAEVLRQAGAAAGRQTGGWPDAPYWHVVEREQRGAKVATREIWQGHHAAGVLRDPLVTGEGEATITLGPGPALFLDPPVGWDALYQLPTDPAALEQRLRADAKACGCGPDPDSEVFDEATEALTESPASPELRKALWEVAARVPGTRLIGPATDAMGRHGTALERDDEIFVVDTATGQLLEDSGAGHGSVDGQPVTYGDGVGYRYTFVSQGPADTAPPVTASS